MNSIIKTTHDITVSQLIAELSNLPPDAQVEVLHSDYNGYNLVHNFKDITLVFSANHNALTLVAEEDVDYVKWSNDASGNWRY